MNALLTLNSVVQDDVRAVAEELRDTLAPLAGSTILITGGSGFLCSYFLETIAWLNDTAWHSPCRVITADNLRSGVAERVAHLAGRPDFRFLIHDVSQPFSIDEPVEWIIHGAGIASPTFYRKYPLETIDVNVMGTRHILELAKRQNARSVLYLSSSEIYGDPDQRNIPTAEDYRGYVSCIGPRACYDESKRMAETLCGVYRNLHNVRVKVVRPFNVYGPGQRLDDGRVVPDLISAALQRRPIVLHSDGRATRSFCYIRDAIRAMCLILMSDAEGETFNVGSDEKEISVAELAYEVSRVAGPPTLQVIHRKSDDAHYLTDNPQRRCPDLTKLRERFSWNPTVKPHGGIAQNAGFIQGERMRIAVIGTGYVGLVTGACLAHLGHDVTCVDKAPERVAAVNRAEAPFHEPGLAEMLSECVAAGRLRASNDGVDVVANSELIFLAVGTPCRNNQIDLSYLSAAAEDVGKGLRRGKHQTVVVKSTVVPGTTDTLIRGILERASGLTAGIVWAVRESRVPPRGFCRLGLHGRRSHRSRTVGQAERSRAG